MAGRQWPCGRCGECDRCAGRIAWLLERVDARVARERVAALKAASARRLLAGVRLLERPEMALRAERLMTGDAAEASLEEDDSAELETTD